MYFVGRLNHVNFPRQKRSSQRKSWLPRETFLSSHYQPMALQLRNSAIGHREAGEVLVALEGVALLGLGCTRIDDSFCLGLAECLWAGVRVGRCHGMGSFCIMDILERAFCMGALRHILHNLGYAFLGVSDARLLEWVSRLDHMSFSHLLAYSLISMYIGDSYCGEEKVTPVPFAAQLSEGRPSAARGSQETLF